MNARQNTDPHYILIENRSHKQNPRCISWKSQLPNDLIHFLSTNSTLHQANVCLLSLQLLGDFDIYVNQFTKFVSFFSQIQIMSYDFKNSSINTPKMKIIRDKQELNTYSASKAKKIVNPLCVWEKILKRNLENDI